MAIFSGLLFLTLPTGGVGGSFIAFYGVFLALFLTAGLGSGSTFQMISVIFRKLTMDRVKAEGGSDEEPCVKRRPIRRRRWALFPRLARLAAFYSESVWFIFSLNRFASRRDEGLSYFLYRLRRYYLGGIWTSF